MQMLHFIFLGDSDLTSDRSGCGNMRSLRALGLLGLVCRGHESKKRFLHPQNLYMRFS